MNGEVWQDLSAENTIDGSAKSPALQFLKIDKEFETIDEPFQARAEFWESLKIYPEREYYQ